MKSKHKDYATIFKALCDEKRLMILEHLQSGEKCACVLIEAMNMGQSTLSYHMKILCESGVVESRQDGKWTHYHISKLGSEKASQVLNEITTLNTDIHEKQCGCK